MELERIAVAKAIDNLAINSNAFINGSTVPALSGRIFASENPATGQTIAQIAECDERDVNLAVKSARAAFEAGSRSKAAPADRKRTLLRFAEQMEKHAMELAILDCLEAGKPISDCIGIDIPEAIKAIRWHAEAGDKIYDQLAPTGPGSIGMIVREPVGVVGAVLPWNFPAMMVAWKLGPALAMGNSLVLKPAEQTSLSAILLAHLAAEAGLPPGVFNVVPGYGETAGQAIGRHADVDLVTFTGSTEVGRLFLKYAAESNLKEIVLECGGKSPQVVMADVYDLDQAAENIVNAAFWNMGENCSCGSRLIVEEKIHDSLLEKVISLAGAWKVGDPLDPAVKVGPLIEAGHLKKVLGYIDSGRADGANIVIGGRRGVPGVTGYFVEPTVFSDVASHMAIAQEEIFGPVLSTISVHDEEEAIRVANDTKYGLAASLYTSDVRRAHRMSRAIQAGTVSVNVYSEGDITTPFGGFKQSGFGGRDKGFHAHDQYSALKTIWIRN